LPLIRRWNESDTLSGMLQPILDRLTAYTGQHQCLPCQMAQILVAYAPPTDSKAPCGITLSLEKRIQYILARQAKHMRHSCRVRNGIDYSTIDHLPIITEHSPVELNALHQEFAVIRERGFASTMGGYDPIIFALAIPIFVRDTFYGRLTSAAPITKMCKLEPRILSLLQQAANVIDLTIGGTQDPSTRNSKQPLTRRPNIHEEIA
jgi:hypothetical protein